jgi:hypothetical protein
MSLPTTPAPNPASAQSLDAAASNADASAETGDVNSAVAACPPGPTSKPAPPPPPAPVPPGPKSFIEILVTDENDKPVANQRYRLKLTDGSLQEGKLDGNGRIYLNPIPAGVCELMFLEMIDIGVPQDEIKRSWNWKPDKGGAPKVKKDLRSAASPGDSASSAEPGTDDSSEEVSTSDDSAEEED